MNLTTNIKKRILKILNFASSGQSDGLGVGFGFDVPAREAIRHFEQKGLKPTFSYADMAADEHRSAFTVAKMMDMDLLQDMQDSIRQALKQGWSYQQWADRIIPHLQANGWWGRQAVLDPITGQTVIAELGSARRLQVIFRTNLQSAYAVGRWQKIMQQKEQAPFLLYDAVDDHRTRPQHRAWNNKVLPVDHPFWRTHTPPNGYMCRCSVIQLSQDDLDDMGLTVSESPDVQMVEWKNPRTGQIERIPKGVDAGFGANLGQARYDMLQRLAQEKMIALEDAQMRAAAQQAFDDARNAPQISENQVIATALGEDAAKIKPAQNQGYQTFSVLSEDQHRAVTLYTSHYYKQINRPLLHHAAPTELLQFANLLDRALALSPKHVGVSTRAFNLSEPALQTYIAEHQAALLSGQAVEYASFTSSTIKPKPDYQGNIILHIQGYSGVLVAPISRNPNELEVLFSLQAHFLVLKMQYDDQSMIHQIWLKEH